MTRSVSQGLGTRDRRVNGVSLRHFDFWTSHYRLIPVQPTYERWKSNIPFPTYLETKRRCGGRAQRADIALTDKLGVMGDWGHVHSLGDVRVAKGCRVALGQAHRCRPQCVRVLGRVLFALPTFFFSNLFFELPAIATFPFYRLRTRCGSTMVHYSPPQRWHDAVEWIGGQGPAASGMHASDMMWRLHRRA